jgi:hypothetical protein
MAAHGRPADRSMKRDSVISGGVVWACVFALVIAAAVVADIAISNPAAAYIVICAVWVIWMINLGFLIACIRDDARSVRHSRRMSLSFAILGVLALRWLDVLQGSELPPGLLIDEQIQWFVLPAFFVIAFLFHQFFVQTAGRPLWLTVLRNRAG